MSVNLDFDLLNLPGKKLGGGFKGYMAKTVITNDHDNSFAQERFTLTNAWNTRVYSGPFGTIGRAITPFRAVNNAGDILSRPNYSCGGTCQSFQSRPGLYGLRQKLGGIQNICDLSRVPPSACNVKYVYDSSDYTNYKRKLQLNKNYNDSSFGGDRSNAAQSTIRASYRF
jgi:hypothetical protein